MAIKCTALSAGCGCLVLSFLAASLAVGAAEPDRIVVDFSKEVGRIRPLNGVCNTTPLTGGLDAQVRKLEIPIFRFHDAALENPGYQLVDISRVFPLFHADADDPRNYNFKATDDYLRQCVDMGAAIEFRLGESIEHGVNKYAVNPPPDFEKWADICCHIIRHYNEGWANGFKWDIRLWSIWEEPDTNPQLLTGKNPFVDTYLPLYKATATRIKRVFPHLKVCGPQGVRTMNLKPFVDYCAANKLPLDVYAISGYQRDPEGYAEMVRETRAYLDKTGYRDTQISIVEWHWAPQGWDIWADPKNARLSKAWSASICNLDSGAFAAAMLSHMQDTPVDYMFFYTMRSGTFGLFGGNNLPLPSYWAFLAFAQLARGDVRVAAPLRPRAGWWTLASKETKSGRGRLLVTALRSDGLPGPIVLKGGVKPVSVKVFDSAHDLEEIAEWAWDVERQELSIPRNVGDSTIWLVETKPL